jgi:phage terminase Nu1 subunit (DNA packaging protein)
MRRLHEAEKTVIMLGGEREAPEMVRAQRDMIKLEKEYYAEECVTMNFILIFVSIIGGLATFVYKLTHGSL